METTLNQRLMKQSSSFVDKTPEIGQVMDQSVYGIGINDQSKIIDENTFMKNPESNKK